MDHLITPSRRGFILGLSTLIAAPAIVRATSIMPVKSMTPILEAPVGNWSLVGGPRGEMWVHNPLRSAAFAREAEAMFNKFPTQFDMTYAAYPATWGKYN